MLKLIGILMVLVAGWGVADRASAHPDPQLLGRETVVSLPGPTRAETRLVWVALPPDYEAWPDRRYDVVYVLDGRGLFPSAVAAARFLATYEGAPPVIVVGIDSLGPAERRRDFTPTPGDGPPQGSGGAAAFLDFLAETVLPHVDGAYRTRPRRLLIGHSLSGLFALHVRLSRPDLFAHHLAISPTLGWDGAEILSRIAEPPRRTGQGLGSAYVSMADDAPSYLAAMAELERLVVRRPEWTLARFPGHSHVTTVPPALFAGMRLWSTPTP